MIKAVIFDRDGVLIDSEYTNVRAAELAFEELGVTLTDEDKQTIPGHHVDVFSKPLLEKYGVEYDQFRPLHRKYYAELLKTTPVFEHTIQLLKDLHARGIPLALCTSAKIESSLELLDRLGIRDLFTVLIGAEDYTNRKPDPEPYLVAAHKLDFDPTDCLAIEDSEASVRSAVGAGMRCIVIFNGYTKGHDFTGATKVVASARELNIDDILI